MQHMTFKKVIEKEKEKKKCIQWGAFNLTVLWVFENSFKKKIRLIFKNYLISSIFKTLEPKGRDDLSTQEYSPKGENEVLLKKLFLNT